VFASGFSTTSYPTVPEAGGRSSRGDDGLLVDHSAGRAVGWEVKSPEGEVGRRVRQQGKGDAQGPPMKLPGGAA